MFVASVLLFTYNYCFLLFSSVFSELIQAKIYFIASVLLSAYNDCFLLLSSAYETQENLPPNYSQVKRVALQDFLALDPYDFCDKCIGRGCSRGATCDKCRLSLEKQ